MLLCLRMSAYAYALQKSFTSCAIIENNLKNKD